MSDRFDYPLDFGIILHSTSETIWNEEVERDHGLMAVRTACACMTSECTMSPREHVQFIFKDDEQDLRDVAAFLAPYYTETRVELQERFVSYREYHAFREHELRSRGG